MRTLIIELRMSPYLCRTVVYLGGDFPDDHLTGSQNKLSLLYSFRFDPQALPEDLQQLLRIAEEA